MRKYLGKIAIVSLALITISCNRDKTGTVSTNAFVDYDADSVFYKIDVKDDEEKEELLVARELFVRDSSFGIYNYDNSQKAFKYAKQNNYNPYLLYKEKTEKKGIKLGADFLIYSEIKEFKDAFLQKTILIH